MLNLNTNEQVDLFTDTLLNIFKNFIPHKNIKCSYSEPPWRTKEITTALRKKNRLHKKYISNNMSKSSHYSNLANKLNNPITGPKAFRSILNRFLGMKKIPTIPPLLVNDIFESTSNIFNKYFAKQCSIIDNGSVLPNMTYKTDNRINEVLLSRELILNIIKDLNPNKAHDCDGISIKMIKMCGDSIAIPLMIIFNTALNTGVFPDLWKKGNIVPAHKKESKHIVKNYRPISLLPLFGKIFEKLFLIVYFIIFIEITYYPKINQVFVLVLHVFRN